LVPARPRSFTPTPTARQFYTAERSLALVIKSKATLERHMASCNQRGVLTL
jgi:hypothetical protein